MKCIHKWKKILSDDDKIIVRCQKCGLTRVIDLTKDITDDDIVYMSEVDFDEIYDDRNN